MSLSESDKDRIAAIVNRARDGYQNGNPELWKDGDPEIKLEEFFAGLGSEATRFAMSLLEQDIARLEERGPDPLIEQIDAIQRCAICGNPVQSRSGEMVKKHSGTSVCWPCFERDRLRR